MVAKAMVAKANSRGVEVTIVRVAMYMLLADLFPKTCSWYGQVLSYPFAGWISM
jgi:hypothetical protein